MSVQLLRVLVLQLSIVTVTGCWPYVAAVDPVVEPLRLQPRRKLRTCAALETMAGEAPKTLDLVAACSHHTIDVDLWYCRANELEYYAGNLRYWIDRATSQCAEPRGGS